MNEPHGERETIGPVRAALAASAAAGALLAGMTFTAATVTLEPNASPNLLSPPALFATFLGAIFGAFFGTAGIGLRHFALGLAAGALPPLVATGVFIGLSSFGSDWSFWWRLSPRGINILAALLVCIALFGAICSGTAAIFSRAARLDAVRFSLREILAMTVLWCGYFACLRVMHDLS